jgi:hypothetical protein
MLTCTTENTTQADPSKAARVFDLKHRNPAARTSSVLLCNFRSFYVPVQGGQQLVPLWSL